MGESIVVSELTKPDFYGTDLYEKLYTIKQNSRFEFAQVYDQVKSRAKDYGAGTVFKQSWEGYESDLKRSGSSLKVTEFTNQPIELECGEWTATDNCVTKYEKGIELKACNHPIMITKLLENIDTDVMKVELAYQLNGRWRTCIVDKKTISSAKSIVELADRGISVTTETAKALVKYLYDLDEYNRGIIPQKKSVTRLGWIGQEGFSPYVKGLEYDGDMSFKPIFDSVKPKGSEKKWLEAVLEIRETGSVPARLVLATSFASVLVEICGCLPFFLHLWGGTGTGKTVGLKLAASVWASPKMSTFITSFNSTAVGQELKAGFLNSMPLVLDELQIAKDKKDFDQMIYQLTEGVGRTRGQKTGGLQKTTEWRNCIITSGEQPINIESSGGGAINRVIEVGCSDARLFADPSGLCDVIDKNYGYAGKKLVDWIQEGDNADKVREMQKAFYKRVVEYGVTEKQAQSASVILTADKLIEAVIFQDGITLDIADIVPFLSSNQDVDVNERAFDLFMGWIAQNSNNIEQYEYNPAICYGVRFADGIAIIRNAFNDFCSKNGISSRAFSKWLHDKGYTECDKGRHDKMVRIGGHTCRCIKILEKMLPVVTS